MALPKDPKERKEIPLYTGLMKYFPDALVAVAHLSFVGNKQHNPGEPLHWAREKSTDQEDTILRHLMESGTIDTDGVRHSTKVAWRALAMLQLELEAAHKDADDTGGTSDAIPKAPVVYFTPEFKRALERQLGTNHPYAASNGTRVLVRSKVQGPPYVQRSTIQPSSFDDSLQGVPTGPKDNPDEFVYPQISNRDSNG